MKSSTQVSSKSITQKIIITLFMMMIAAASQTFAQMQVENLNRGLIAVQRGNAHYLSWRLLANEPYNTGFNVYRGPTLLNTSGPITGATIYTDNNNSASNVYTVRAVVNGVEQAASVPALRMTNTDGDNSAYLHIALQRPPTGRHGGTYTANDGSVGDLDGDGQYELIIKWDPNNAKDNSQSGTTDNVIIDAYRLDGTRLWRIDLGENIRAGAHYTQFLVYDFDGDGRAEIMMKTAEGTRDGTGSFIRTGPAASANHSAIHRNESGYILRGAEYLTVFDGLTGAELATADYWPVRDPINGWGNNEGYGNRVDRFNAAVAYVDGQRPSAIFQRGYYDRMTLAAWDWRNGRLTRRWTFDSGSSGSTGNARFRGQGNHQLSVADVDGSGRHSIITGAAVIGPDGRGMHTSGRGHGDALHVAHMIKGHPTPQIFMPYESGTQQISLRHASDGRDIFVKHASSAGDVGRGVAAPLAPGGWYFWSSAGNDIFDIRGERVGSRPHNGNANSPVTMQNHLVWWDGTLNRANVTRNQVASWNAVTSSGSRLLTATGAEHNNGTKENPVLTADIFGDWREEIIWRVGADAVRIWTSTMTTNHRLVTMMHDPVYRVAVAWQNSSYNQPAHPGYYIASDMDPLTEFPMNVVVIGDEGVAQIEYEWCVADGRCTEVIKGTCAGDVVTVCPDPPSYALRGSGEFIDSLKVFDIPNAAAWSIRNNFAAGDSAFGDRTHSLVSVPEDLVGAEWIRPSMETRRLTSPETIISFKMKKAGVVNVLYEGRVEPKPAWLAGEGFVPTALTAHANDGSEEGRVFTVFTKSFAAGETVNMGINSNDGTTLSLMYLVAIVAPPSRVFLGGGVFIDSLFLYDPANADAWSINGGFNIDVLAYGDRSYPVTNVPEALRGAEWITPSMETRRLVEPETMLRFQMARSATVYILYEDRVADKPAWLADGGFTATDMTATVDDVPDSEENAHRTFTIYSKTFAAGETVTMGVNSTDGTAQSLMYMVAVTDGTTSTVYVDRRQRHVSNALNITRSGRGVFNINYSLSNAGNVRIEMFDIRGRRVRTIVNTSRSAGNHVERFNVGRLSAGTYIIRLQAGDVKLQERVTVRR